MNLSAARLPAPEGPGGVPRKGRAATARRRSSLVLQEVQSYG